MLPTANNWSVYSLLLLFAKINKILSTEGSHCMISKTKLIFCDNKLYILISPAAGNHSLNAEINSR